MDTNTQKALESLRRRKVNASIAIAADLANDNLNSICRLALARRRNARILEVFFLYLPFHFLPGSGMAKWNPPFISPSVCTS